MASRQKFSLEPAKQIVTIRFVLLVLLFLGCVLWGGSARVDASGLIFLQPAAILIGGVALLLPAPLHFRRFIVPLLLFLALAAVVTSQLIPLPPGVWEALPGHAQFLPAIDAVGRPWRPISLTPDLTLASLVGLGVPFAVLLCAVALPPGRTQALLPYLIGASVLSAALGLVQIAGAPDSPLYRYEITNHGDAVGFFANRNHQALLLATTFPMLAVWVRIPHGNAGFDVFRHWFAAAVAIFLVPMVLVTGSRAGIFLMIVGIIFAAYLFLVGRARRMAEANPARLLAGAGVLGAVLVGVLGLAVYFSRAVSIDRLQGQAMLDDQRVTYTPLLTDIAWDFFPFGSGLGSFDPVFRFYEPMEQLKPTYLNHAHNEVLEMLITGGLPGMLVVLAFLGWFGFRTWRIFRKAPRSSPDLFALLGWAFCVLTLVSSLVDYPVRTPWLAALFALCCVWLAEHGHKAEDADAARGAEEWPESRAGRRA
jgi:O-antigen ligase